MILLILLLCVTGCLQRPAVIPKGEWIIITPKADPPPKTFIEKTWPHWEKPWIFKPSNTPWRMPPLQVV